MGTQGIEPVTFRCDVLFIRMRTYFVLTNYTAIYSKAFLVINKLSFSETFRKYPPVSLLNRECTKAYNIPGSRAVLEEGTHVVVPVLGLHRDPAYYPDPEMFDPERFTPEAMENRHRYVFLPFGEGPRVCIGESW